MTIRIIFSAGHLELKKSEESIWMSCLVQPNKVKEVAVNKVQTGDNKPLLQPVPHSVLYGTCFGYTKE